MKNRINTSDCSVIVSRRHRSLSAGSHERGDQVADDFVVLVRPHPPSRVSLEAITDYLVQSHTPTATTREAAAEPSQTSTQPLLSRPQTVTTAFKEAKG